MGSYRRNKENVRNWAHIILTKMIFSYHENMGNGVQPVEVGWMKPIDTCYGLPQAKGYNPQYLLFVDVSIQSLRQYMKGVVGSIPEE